MSKLQVRLERDTEKRLARFRNSEPFLLPMSLSQITNMLVLEALKAREQSKEKKEVAA